MNPRPHHSNLAPHRRKTAAAAALLLLTFACQQSAGDGSGDSPAFQRHTVEVHATKARRLALHPQLELVGRLEAIPEKTAQVAALVQGTIIELVAREGQRIDSGQVLARLDATLFDAAAARAEAVVDERGALLDRLEAGPRPEEIAAGQAALRRTEVIARSAAAQLAALERLAAGTELSPIRLEQARSKRESADADSASAHAALDLLIAGTRPERLAEARAALAAARADLADATARQGFAVVRAPLPGTVTNLIARVGQGVAAADVLLEIVDLDTLLLRVRIPAKVLPRVPVDTLCDLSFDALPARTLRGRIDRFGGRGDLATGGVWAFIALANDDQVLRPNMTGRASMALAALPPSIVVPASCAAERAGVSVVTVIQGGTAHEVEVQIGVRAEGLVQVLAGVAEGDWVATRGGYGLPDGQAVTLVPDPDGVAGH